MRTMAAPPRYWLSYPEHATKWTCTFKQRLFGPLYSHTKRRLGFLGRLLYGWFITDDLYFERVDHELKEKGF